MNLLFSFSFLSFQVICGSKLWSYKSLSDFPANFRYQFLSLIRSPVVRSSGLTIASQIRYQYPFLLLFPFFSGDPWFKALVLQEPLGFHCQIPISISFYIQVIRGAKLWSYIASRIQYQCPFLLPFPCLSGDPWSDALVSDFTTKFQYQFLSLFRSSMVQTLVLR